MAETLQLLVGRLLAVFARGKHRVQTATAIIGVRGTGIYVEADPEQSYLCTWYGAVDLYATSDKTSREYIVTKYHDKPRYILAGGSAGALIRSAPPINHTDMELKLIEELVGRSLPFKYPNDGHGDPYGNDYG